MPIATDPINRIAGWPPHRQAHILRCARMPALASPAPATVPPTLAGAPARGARHLRGRAWVSTRSSNEDASQTKGRRVSVSMKNPRPLRGCLIPRSNILCRCPPEGLMQSDPRTGIARGRHQRGRQCPPLGWRSLRTNNGIIRTMPKYGETTPMGLEAVLKAALGTAPESTGPPTKHMYFVGLCKDPP